MKKESGGSALIRALADENVDLLFGYPGGAALHIYDAIYQQDKVQHILVRHGRQQSMQLMDMPELPEKLELFL